MAVPTPMPADLPDCRKCGHRSELHYADRERSDYNLFCVVVGCKCDGFLEKEVI
jgi:hypothetical protein